MPLQKLDKKQVPQVAVLAVLSCGVLGFFAKQLATPSPAAAHSAPPATASPSAQQAVSTGPHVGAREAPPAPNIGGAGESSPAVSLSPPTGQVAPELGDGGPDAPPVDAGRDPFQQTVSGTAAPAPAPKSASLVRPLPAPRMASITVPAAPPLPAPGAFGGLRPLPSYSVPGQPAPIAQAAPTWAVTGVLTSGADHIAILRSGTERRFVRQGEWLDGQFKVAHVGRDSVTLSRGSAFYSLPLGGGKASGGQTNPAPNSGATFPVGDVPQGGVNTRFAPPLSGVGGPPSAISLRETPRSGTRPTAKVVGHAVLASVLHVWTRPNPARQAALVNQFAAPRLAFSAPQPMLTLPVLTRPMLKPVVKVAAFRARSMVKKHVVKSMVSHPAPHGMLAIGSAAPDFTLHALDGNAVSLSHLRGGPVVLTFWASWVGACGPAVPALQRAASEGHAAFVGVGTWDSRPALLSFARTHGLPARSVLCDDSAANLSIAVSLFKVPDVPACYVLDRDGRVVAAFLGFGPDTAEAVRAILLTLDAS